MALPAAVPGSQLTERRLARSAWRSNLPRGLLRPSQVLGPSSSVTGKGGTIATVLADIRASLGTAARLGTSAAPVVELLDAQVNVFAVALTGDDEAADDNPAVVALRQPVDEVAAISAGEVDGAPVEGLSRAAWRLVDRGSRPGACLTLSGIPARPGPWLRARRLRATGTGPSLGTGSADRLPPRGPPGVHPGADAARTRYGHRPTARDRYRGRRPRRRGGRRLARHAASARPSLHDRVVDIAKHTELCGSRPHGGADAPTSGRVALTPGQVGGGAPRGQCRPVSRAIGRPRSSTRTSLPRRTSRR